MVDSESPRNVLKSRPSAQLTRPSLPTSRSYLLLGVGFVAFALYGSLIPFDLNPSGSQSARERLLALLTTRHAISRTDALANALLFAPIGFTLAATFLVDRHSRFRALVSTLAVLGLSLLVSVTAEFLQTFHSARVASSVDIVAQTLGCILGIGAWLWFGDELTRWIRTTVVSESADRLTRALAVCTAAWVFVSLAPFDITVDAGDLAARVRSGAISIIPFSRLDGGPTARLWDTVVGIITAMPLGALAVVGWNKSHVRSPVAAFALGGSLVAAVESAQVFIASHTADATDVVAGWLGVCCGIALVRAHLRGSALTPGARHAAAAAPRRRPELFAAWSLVLALYHWQPFDFAVQEDLISSKLVGISLMPFNAYYAGSYLNALSDALTKLMLSFPAGLAAAYASGPRAGRPLVALAWIMAAGLVFVVIECGQFFLPTRMPDPTDVLVGVIGTCLGYVAGRWLWTVS